MQEASAPQSGTAARLSRDPDLRFGPFSLLGTQKLLLDGGQPVRLGSRALELLTVLVERAGEVVSRGELEARVWPQTMVEETSLRVHIAALRKVLADRHGAMRYITNIPGRGYCFVAPVTRGSVSSDATEPARPDAASLHNLPVRLTRTIGRAEVVAALGERIARRRLVSVVGPGGVGKTTVALAVAQARLGAYTHGARFVDLAPLSDPSLVPAALAAVLGMGVTTDTPLPALCAFLRDCRMLLVLDNCEHVRDAAADLAEAILKAAPDVHILTTSREALDAEGEWVHRLPSLEMPTLSEPLDTDKAMSFPAIALFVERAGAASQSFVLSQANLPVVRHLCRHLDGMPLAIELAAARVDSLGLQGLTARLDDLFHLLTRGRRTAMPRHRTLPALIGWSHDLLSDTERVVFMRLSVFRSSFTRESAGCVAACGHIAVPAVMEGLVSLCAKSLVAIDGSGDTVRYRLLLATRMYAMERLAESGETPALERRHAEHFRDLLQRAGEEREAMAIADWLGKYARTMDDVRAGLDWAFSPGGDALLGASLTAAAIHLAFELGLNDEYRQRIDLALETVRTMEPAEPALELRLCSALFFMVGVTSGRPDPGGAVLARTMELADRLGSRRDKVEAMFGASLIDFRQADYLAVIAWGERIGALAVDASEPLAIGHHYMGNHRYAAQLAGGVLRSATALVTRQYLGYVPRTVTMRYLLARIAWLEGRSDEAVQRAQECVDHAAGSHPLGLSQALRTAITIALWRGDNSHARDMVDRLDEHAIRHSLVSWQSSVRNFRQVLGSRERSPAGAAAFAPRDWTPPTHMGELDALGTFSEHMLLPATLDRVERGRVGWCAPEVLRAHAVNRLRVGAMDTVAAEAVFTRSLRMAGAQGALAWELRTAISIARLWQQQRRTAQARELLGSVWERFSEGLDTADALQARQLLVELEAQPAAAARYRSA